MNLFLRGFVHDIRTAVGVIQQCLDPLVQNDKSFDHDAMVRRQVNHALELVHQLEMNVGRDNDGCHLQSVDSIRLRAFLDEFVGLYPKVQVRFNCVSECRIFVDLHILKRVVDNCITNAIHAGRSEWVLLTCDNDDEILNIHIKDRGCGMEKKQLERIGLGFSTTGGGSGVKILIDLLMRTGGVIRWNSIKDIGTCVTITFKLMDGKHGTDTQEVPNG